MKVLFLVKDMGGANVTVPIASIARAKGDEVTVVTEGLASESFEKAGFSPRFKGTVDWRVEPFTLDATLFLRKVMPDVLVAAEGSPNHLEGEFGLAANEAGIPLVAVDDFWNGASRLQGAKPGLVLALDEYDVLLNRGNRPQAKCVIAGNPGCPTEDQILGMRGLPEVEKLRERFDRVIVYIGAGETTTAEIELLLACLAMTPGNWCLVPRFHPKHKDLASPDGRLFGEVWKDQLAVLGDRVVYLNGVNKTDPIVVSADVTISSFSTLLTTAAAAGRTAVSLWIPAVEASLKKQAGLDQVPVVALHCAESVSEPIDLGAFAPALPADRMKLWPFDGELAYEAVREFIGK